MSGRLTDPLRDARARTEELRDLAEAARHAAARVEASPRGAAGTRRLRSGRGVLQVAISFRAAADALGDYLDQLEAARHRLLAIEEMLRATRAAAAAPTVEPAHAAGDHALGRAEAVDEQLDRLETMAAAVRADADAAAGACAATLAHLTPDAAAAAHALGALDDALELARERLVALTSGADPASRLVAPPSAP